MGSEKQTTYTIKRYNGNLASFISGIVTGIKVSSNIANNMVGNIVASGIGTIIGSIINITSSIPSSCKSYAYSYYGKDSGGEKSDTYSNCGHKYIINDDERVVFYNDKYYNGFVYGKIDDGNDYRLSAKIVNNLYGIDFDVE